MEDVVTSVLFKLSEHIVKPVLISPLRPIFCFQSIVNDFRDTNGRLRPIREEVERRVQQARSNAHVIRIDVQEWIAAANAATSNVQCMENQLMEANRSCLCYTWCPNWTCHYRLSKQVMKITATMKKLCKDGDFRSVSYLAPLRQGVGSFSLVGFFFSESVKSAFDQTMEALRNVDVNMIGLCGMGGIGKTSLAKLVQMEAVKLEIFDHVVMVTVSQTPEVRNIQDVIAEFLGLELNEKTEDGRVSRLNQRLKTEKMLIILDDVWKPFNLACIGIYGDECKGSKFLFTTRRMDVCTCMGSEINIQLNLFSENEAHSFFMEKAGLSELNDVAKQIVAECECLPIALATVGAALRNKGEDEWELALDNLKHARLVDICGINDKEKNTYKCLQLSYDYLEHSAEVQQAQFILLLCSLFPEDNKIDLEDLTRCAFGMELFERVEIIEDARRNVRIAIQFLKDSCLLLGTDDKKCVKVHDMVRDAVLWIGGKKPPERNVFTVRDGRDLKELMKRKSFQNCRAISFMADSLTALSKYELVCPNLEAILIFGGDEDGFGFELPDKFFKHMKLVKVLALRSAGKWTKCRFAMPHSLQNLSDLRTLILRYCECLNSSILRELGNLEILCLEGSNIDCGVEVVMALRKLRLLDLSPLSVERMFPSNIMETLFKLEELYNYYFGECVAEGINSGGSLSELELLSNLVVLFTKVENVRCLPKDFCFPNLQRYNINVGTNVHRELQDSRRRGLVLEGVEDESVIISAFKNLLPAVQDLYLQGCKHLYSLSALEGFLQNLEVEDCINMEWVFEFQGDQVISDNSIVHLQLLKKLRLRRLPALKQIQKGPSSFLSLCNVTEVEMEYCSKVTCIFSSPSNLQQLEILTVRRCGNLVEIIGSSGGHGDEDDVTCYPNLRMLQIEECHKLRTMFPGTAHPQSHCRLPKLEQLLLSDNAELQHVFGHETWLEVERDCPLLEKLSVHNCPKMSTHFAASHFQASSSKATKYNHLQDDFQVIKEIVLGDSQGVEETIQLQRQDDTDDGSSAFHWGKLHLCKLVGSIQDRGLTRLHQLAVIDCNELKHLFGTSATSVHKLELLIGRECNELEEIIILVEDVTTELTPSVGFNNFRILCASDCGELKPILPTAVNLQKLLDHVNGQSSFVGTVKSQIQAPSKSKQSEIMELSNTVEEMIELQKHDEQPLTFDLTLMKLEDLANLKGTRSDPIQNIVFTFLSGASVIGFSGSKDFKVEGCPKVTTEFFSTPSYKHGEGDSNVKSDNMMVDAIDSVRKIVSVKKVGGKVATLSAPTGVASETNKGKDGAATASQDLCEGDKR